MMMEKDESEEKDWPLHLYSIKKRGRVAAAASWVLTSRASTSLSLTAVAGVLVVAAQGIVLVAVAVSSLMANTMQASTAALGC